MKLGKLLKNGIAIGSAILVLILGVVLFQTVEYVNNDEYAIHQSAISGDLTVWSTPGYHPRFFGDVWKYKKTGDIFLSSDKLDGGDGADVQPVRVQFADGWADIDVVTKYSTPITDKKRKALFIQYGDADAVKASVRQVLIEGFKYVGPTMSSSEAYSDRRHEVATLAKEMSLEGIYKSVVKYDTTTTEDGKINIIKKYDVYRDKNGHPVVTKVSMLKEFGIGIVQFTVKNMNFDPETKKVIAGRKKAQLALQEAITAEEKGKARIAEAKAEKEVEKISAVTEAEKTRDVAVLDAEREKQIAIIEGEKLKTVAALKKDAAKLDAEATIITAKAKQKELQLANGLSEERKYELDTYKETNIGVAEHMAKRKLPDNLNVVIGGSGGGKDGKEASASELLILKMLQDSHIKNISGATR